MKIWMVCETLAEGCAPNVTVLEIRQSLERQGHEVVLFSPATEGKHTAPLGHNVCLVPTIDILGLKVKYAVYQLFLIPSMVRQYLKSRPAWIYSRPLLAMVTPALMSRLMSVPHFLHLSGDPLEQLKMAKSSWLLRGMYWAVERTNCRLSRIVIVETSGNRTVYEKRHGLPSGRVVHIPNGVNLGLFRPLESLSSRREIGMPDDRPCVGFVGNLTKREGTEYLIEATSVILRKVPEVLFLIVGDGPERKRLTEMCQRGEVRDKVVFVGKVPYGRVPIYIAAMDVCVVPLDKGHFEKMGISSLKLREYLACGRPVVGSDIEGIGDILREAKAGIPTVPEDAGQFAQAIVQLLQDEPLRMQMGKNGWEYAVRNLSWDATVRGLMRAYEGLLVGRRTNA